MNDPTGPLQESPTLSKTERREYIAGVATACVLAGLLVFTALANRGKAATAEGAFTLTAEFHRADGVHVGSPVRIAGMTIGAVTAATLDDGAQAVLTMKLSQSVPLPDDTAAVIETDGIFGSKYIELRPGGTEEMLKSGARISYSQDSVIIEDLIALIVQRAKDARASKSTEPYAPNAGETP